MTDAKHRLTRRRLVQGAVGLGLLAGCGRLPGQTQVPAKAPRIGMLWFNSPEVFEPILASFREGLREFGYADGENILIELRWADGHSERFPTLAAELVASPVDLLVTASEAAAQAAKQATSSIPIVMGTSSNPVGTGLVASLARPGGNITGLSAISSQ